MDPLAPLLLGAAIAVFGLLWLAARRSPKTCGACGRALPEIRRPVSLEQAVHGGVTCPGCGAELDARGRVKSTRK